jgi:hypothetical protein
VSDLDLTEAIDTATTAAMDSPEWRPPGYTGATVVRAVEAAAPLIEEAARRDERERIAAKMTKCAQDFDPGTWPHRAYMDAAETARGEQP